MKNGIQQIAEERLKQFEKGRRVINDIEENDEGQLPYAAACLLNEDEYFRNAAKATPPFEWDLAVWVKLMDKPYADRVRIAGTLIAAELDRLTAVDGAREGRKITKVSSNDFVAGYQKDVETVCKSAQTSLIVQRHRGTLEMLSELNPARCEQAFGHEVASWSPERWALAMVGEAGEVCNALKKQIRGGDKEATTEDIADEMADVIIYMDLLATRLDIDLADSIKRKFNEVSDRKNCGIKF